MKNIFATAVLLAACGAVQGQTVIAKWTFPTTVPASGVNFQINFPIAADGGVNAATANITTDATVWNGMPTGTDIQQGAFQYFSGTNVNLQSGDVNGSGLSMRGLTGLITNGKSMTFAFSTVGFYDLIMTYAERATATGPSTIDVSTSVDGLTFVPASSLLTTRDATFRTRTIDLSAIDGLENVATAYVRLTVGGISNASGNLRIDNVVVVPTPGTAMLVGAAGLMAARRRRA